MTTAIINPNKTRTARTAIALAIAAFSLSACIPTPVTVRNDDGWEYTDYRGSPYDQLRGPNRGLNQISCPPPQRPICGG